MYVPHKFFKTDSMNIETNHAIDFTELWFRICSKKQQIIVYVPKRICNYGIQFKMNEILSLVQANPCSCRFDFWFFLKTYIHNKHTSNLINTLFIYWVLV